jgi:hypothetical protein
MTAIEEYMNELLLKYEKKLRMNKKMNKINNTNELEQSSVLTFNDYDKLTETNYNIQQLKSFAKFYKLKLSGNKKELINRLYMFLFLSSYIIKIQKIFRGNLQRKFNKYFGPALNKREICINDTDFVTMDDLKDLQYGQFYSFKDVDGTVYGFDIASIYNLIYKNTDSINISKIGGINPYNRNKIPCFVMIDLKMIMRTSKILKIKINLDFDTNIGNVSNTKTVEMRTLSLFQNIDSLGNYSSPEWFLTLNRNQLIKFLRELGEIWNYRAQLSNETKQNICPPNGDPFRNINFTYIINEPELLNLKKIVLDVLEKLVNNGVDRDSKTLGAYYVLGALTLVNDSAATSLPWLFQSVAYF